MNMSIEKEGKDMEDVYNLLKLTNTKKLYVPPADDSGTLTELQSEMISWIWNVDAREHSSPDTPTGLTDLQKEMLRWILHSNSIQVALHNKNLQPEKPNPLKIMSATQDDSDSDIDIEELSSDTPRLIGDSGINGIAMRDVESLVQSRRDIDTIPSILAELDKKTQKNMDLRTRSAMAMILANKLDRQIRTDALEVEDAIENTKKLAKKVCGKMINRILETMKEDSLNGELILPSWSRLLLPLRSEFADVLEKKCIRKNGLMIDRCKKKWLALRFLHEAYGAATTKLSKGETLD